MRVIQDIGYDLRSGRLDKTHHPFMTSIAQGDIRISNRYNTSNFFESLLPTLHEAGHALYESGFLPKYEGTPMGSAISLSVHESQSRLYENLIGRSKAFATYLQPIIHEIFPDETKHLSIEQVWQQMNNIRQTTIRVEADEVTYSLHIVIRMLLEEALITGELEVEELPKAWATLYEKYLSIKVPNDADGVMQDVHWFQSSFGYFPTYALGNLYGATMMESINQAIPDLHSQVAQGEFQELLDWLRVNVHQHGMKDNGEKLIMRISGKPLSHEPFITYIKKKFDLSRKSPL